MEQNELNDEYLEILNNLHKLSKEKLIKLISDFWLKTKQDGIKQNADKVNFRQEEYGRLKITQANYLKILLLDLIGDE